MKIALFAVALGASLTAFASGPGSAGASVPVGEMALADIPCHSWQVVKDGKPPTSITLTNDEIQACTKPDGNLDESCLKSKYNIVPKSGVAN